jgi:hypothetical protein
MTELQILSKISPAPLLRMREALITHQCLYAAAKFGIADLLAEDPRTVTELAHSVKVNEDALYRTLRLLATQGIFEETSPRTFKNTDLSRFLQTGVPGSLRSLFLFWGGEFVYPCFGEIPHSIRTGKSSRTKLCGMNAFEYLRLNPELASIFDIPGCAAFWLTRRMCWNGRAIADFSAVNFRHGPRSKSAISSRPPCGCRAYLMKNVIHDWDDEKARTILSNCRKVIPDDGALLLVELPISGENLPSLGKVVDIAMLVLTGGRERTVDEYRELLASAGFRLHSAVPTAAEFFILEAHPA